MRWTRERPLPPVPGDRRTVRHFAWWPTRVNEYVVWLEPYEVFQVWTGASEHWYEYGRTVLDSY